MTTPHNPFVKLSRPVIGKGHRQQFRTTDELCRNHFSTYSELNHICQSTMTRALSLLGQRPAVIIETGSSAWGTNSSLLFDSYVNSFGGRFSSVDIRRQPRRLLRKACSSQSSFYRGDSVQFLSAIVDLCSQVDLVYLDSWDVDWTNPVASAVHGLREFLMLLPIFRQHGGLLLVDDTPHIDYVSRNLPHLVEPCEKFASQYGFTPGKGALILEFCKSSGCGKILEHQYQALINFEP